MRYCAVVTGQEIKFEAHRSCAPVLLCGPATALSVQSPDRCFPSPDHCRHLVALIARRCATMQAVVYKRCKLEHAEAGNMQCVHPLRGVRALLPRRGEHTLSAPRCSAGHRPNPSAWCRDVFLRPWNLRRRIVAAPRAG